MTRRALIVGVDEYDEVSNLSGCVADAQAMADVLGRHANGTPNFDCRMMTPPGSGSRVTRVTLRQRCVELFDFDGDVVFYFSGHGFSAETGSVLVTQDGTRGDFGMPMNDLMILISKSRVKTALLILDCCFSGALGNIPNCQSPYGLDQAQLRGGVTVLAASRPTEPALEVGGHGVFTHLVVGALRGGAADVRGRVSAASIYAYVEAVLGPWDQRPLYKTHANSLPPVRLCEPSVPDDLLRELTVLFAEPNSRIVMDPSFEETETHLARAENVATFKKFKLLRDARLLRTEAGDDLYYAALNCNAVQLTPLGQFYWRLAREGRI